jgi:glucokinase
MPKTIGIDVGGTFIKAGLVSGSRIVKTYMVPTQAKKGKKTVLKNLFKAIECLMAKDVKGIGIGFPGPIVNGAVKEVQNIPAFKNTNIAKLVSRKYRKRCVVANDANCFALAEQKFGAGKGKKHLVGITLGTGLGCGIVINGIIYAGNTGAAGEISNIPLGNKKMEDNMNSRFLRKVGGKSPLELSISARKGNKRAKKAWKQFGKNLGTGVSIVVDTLDPEMIVFGGQIAKSFFLFKSEMLKEIKKNTFNVVSPAFIIKNDYTCQIWTYHSFAPCHFFHTLKMTASEDPAVLSSQMTFFFVEWVSCDFCLPYASISEKNKVIKILS